MKPAKFKRKEHNAKHQKHSLCTSQFMKSASIQITLRSICSHTATYSAIRRIRLHSTPTRRNLRPVGIGLCRCDPVLLNLIPGITPIF
jgi:hypothetical protein